MKIQTLSIVAGTRACDARCPFCVSKMTGVDALLGNATDINERNFHKTALLAKQAGTTTVLITGKGEPTLYPQVITRYLELLEPYKFPFIELQTNGIRLGKNSRGARGGIHPGTLKTWYGLGLNTIALSTCGVHRSDNRPIYGEEYPEMGQLVDFVHSVGFSVRLCLMMHYGGIYSPGGLDQVIEFCKVHSVDQLTARSIRKPNSSVDSEAAEFVEESGLIPSAEKEIYEHIKATGTLIMKLEHGAEVYDVDGTKRLLE